MENTFQNSPPETKGRGIHPLTFICQWLRVSLWMVNSLALLCGSYVTASGLQKGPQDWSPGKPGYSSDEASTESVGAGIAWSTIALAGIRLRL